MAGIIIHPKAILWATSMDCQYSSGTNEVWRTRALITRNASNPRKSVCSEDIMAVITDGPWTGSKHDTSISSSSDSKFSSGDGRKAFVGGKAGGWKRLCLLRTEERWRRSLGGLFMVLWSLAVERFSWPMLKEKCIWEMRRLSLIMVSHGQLTGWCKALHLPYSMPENPKRSVHHW